MIVIYLHMLVHYKMMTQLHSNHMWKSHMEQYMSIIYLILYHLYSLYHVSGAGIYCNVCVIHD